MRFSWSSLALLSELVSATLPIPRPEHSLLERANATNSTNVATYAVGNDGNFIFSLTVGDNGDMWFQMSVSDTYSYMAVGTGDSMEKSLMFIAYRDGSQNGLTLSGRFASGHTEPTYSKSINLTKVSGQDADGTMTVAGHCLNCTSLSKSTVDLTNEHQNFIWAVGPPGRNPSTTAMDGPLRRHAYYGNFQMDMTAAKGNGMPSLGMTTVNANTYSARPTPVNDSDWADWGHALVMVVAFLFVFPGGVVALRVLNSVKLHMWVQSVGFALGLVGLFSGIYISVLYNRSKSFNSAHQLIGIAIILLMIAQWTGGFLHHRYFVRNQRPWLNGRVIRAHKLFLGPVILSVGIVNAALGFNLAVAGAYNRVYVPLVGVVVLALLGSIFFKSVVKRRIGKRGPNPEAFEPIGPVAGRYDAGAGGRRAGSPGDGYGQRLYPEGGAYGAYNGTRSDIALSTLGEPPAYNEAATQPRTVL